MIAMITVRQRKDSMCCILERIIWQPGICFLRLWKVPEQGDKLISCTENGEQGRV